jgi:hypothetical protein
MDACYGAASQELLDARDEVGDRSQMRPDL